MSEAAFGRGNGTILLYQVRCIVEWYYEIIHCPAFYYPWNCDHGEDAGVKCNNETLIHSVNASMVNSLNTMNLSTFITWERSSRTNEDVTSYKVECYSEDHSAAVTVNKETQNVTLAGLLPSTSYSCCVSAIYHHIYTAKGTCAVVSTSDSGVATTEFEALDSSIIASPSTSVVGGVLGFIILLLLVLLIISVVALVCVLRPRLKNSALGGRYICHVLLYTSMAKFMSGYCEFSLR